MADPDKVFRFGELRPQAVRALGLALESVGAQAEFTAILSAELEDARSRFKKLPEPSGPYPFRMRLGDVIGGAAERAIVANNKLVFHSVGDTGQHGHGALAQDRVALHLEQQLEHANDADRPAFFFHLETSFTLTASWNSTRSSSTSHTAFIGRRSLPYRATTTATAREASDRSSRSSRIFARCGRGGLRCRA
jgi:hypothetical protein